MCRGKSWTLPCCLQCTNPGPWGQTWALSQDHTALQQDPASQVLATPLVLTTGTKTGDIAFTEIAQQNKPMVLRRGCQTSLPVR